MYTFKFVLLLLLPFLGEAKTSKSKNVCGSSLSGPSGSITTPHYPNNYPNNAECVWTIHGPARTKQIDFEFKYFDIEFGAKCEWDYVLIKDKDGNTVGSKLCGRKDSLKVSVPGDLAVIEFKSDAEISEKGFDVKYIIITPTPEPTTGSCNFDQGICPRISNVDNKVDNFDWTVHSGPTPTGYQLTGPKADHTTGKGKYVYIESTGRSKGDKAQLETQVMSGTRCLKFFYHMFGIIGMGSLKVYIVTNNARRLVISLSGDQGDEWKEERVQIRENVPYKVVFEGIVGGSDYSDIAIDDITFSDEECKNWKECGGVLTAPSGSFTSPQYPSNYKDNLRCKWTIRPSKDTSIIIVRFAAFQVEMAPNCRDDYVTISDSNGHSVKKPRFCGFHGNGFGVKVHGKEAEVYFHSNNHLTDKGFNASYETIESTSPADCDFDQGVCQGWTNDFNDDIDWSIGNGFTRSFFTGPHNDIYILGNYAYIEASGRQPGDRAVLLSPSISGPQCLTFHYNMNGQKMGSLSISTHNGMGRKQVWKATGDHGKFWVKESISLDDVQPYKVSFEGIVGNGFTSDIAIDEVSFTSGRCPPKSGCDKILTGSRGSIQSPNYPSHYPSGVDCTWTIIPPPQYSNIAVSFHHIDMQDSLQCSNDYVAVEDIRGTPKGKKLCGKSKTTKTFEVDWHEANVHFHSDSSIVGKGFQASYQAFGYQPVCGGQLSGNGTFESPNYPDNYPNRVTCDWEITAPPGTKEIIIEFEDFAIDDSPITCSYDYVLVYDAQHGREVGKVCGMVKPWPVRVPGNIANVRFQSSHVHVGRGFKARYIAVSQ